MPDDNQQRQEAQPSGGQQGGGQPQGAPAPRPPEFKPISSQEELDAVLGQRLTRERAKFADYDELKAKASKFDEIDEANKTELQKAQDALQKAEQRAAAAEAASLRTKVAQTKGVPAELLEGSTEDELNASADRLLAWRGDTGQQKTPPATSSRVAGERGNEISGPRQLTREDLKTMTPADIEKARKEGQLNELMGVK